MEEKSCSCETPLKYYSIALIQEGVRNPAELFPVGEHAESFLNKDGSVATRRILEVRQRGERSEGLAVGTTPGRRKQTFGRGEKGGGRKGRDPSAGGLSRRRRGLLLRGRFTNLEMRKHSSLSFPFPLRVPWVSN